MQYRECYGFERAVITQMFLILHSSRHLAQLAFIKASLGAGSFSLEVAWLSTEVWNVNLAHLFESHSVQQKVLVDRFYLCIGTLYQPLPGFKPAIQ